MEIKAASEWSGFQTFPEPTQAKLDVLFGNLNQQVLILTHIYIYLLYLTWLLFSYVRWFLLLQNVNTLTILVMGKGGVGKSSIVNSILGERVSSVTAFQVMHYIKFFWRCDFWPFYNIQLRYTGRRVNTADVLTLSRWVHFEHHWHPRASFRWTSQ